MCAFYINLKYSPEETSKLHTKLLKIANNNIQSLVEFNSYNPYDVKENYFLFMGENIQLISRTDGLYKRVQISDDDYDQKVYRIQFGNKSAPPNMILALLKGTGVYKYTTVTGATKTIPKLSLVHLFGKN